MEEVQVLLLRNEGKGGSETRRRKQNDPRSSAICTPLTDTALLIASPPAVAAAQHPRPIFHRSPHSERHREKKAGCPDPKWTNGRSPKGEDNLLYPEQNQGHENTKQNGFTPLKTQECDCQSTNTRIKDKLYIIF